ncbi:hypothetical protein T11_17727 [Trichinella zimbabwensis]|uniref:Uncharacterized protein n=1 Tax=Trichinella zimbabwensis TaxID=268475 RepID=A0A0V1H9S7_9BILA|nr:hypothetical protein T11_17727 [Trichinella zimbabwensis]
MKTGLSEEAEDPLDEKLTYSEAITITLAPTLLKIDSKLEEMEAENRMERIHQSSHKIEKSIYTFHVFTRV